MPQNIVIIGSTGSVGSQALEVISKHPQQFKVAALACYKNIDTLTKQITWFKPEFVAVYKKEAAKLLSKELLKLPLKIRPQVFMGPEGWTKIATLPSAHKTIFCSNGLTALTSLVEAIKTRKQIALATKEIIVAAGEIIMALAKKYDVTIVPIDSEHSAIFQCLQGEDPKNIEKIILTCSGGPFFGKKNKDLKEITVKETLRHPTWKMGKKITVDCATLMNKAFEIIEAKHLFALREDQIEIVIHPESIIHSFVQFKDGSVKAQAALPDMRIPITYALAYPNRLKTAWPRLDFKKFQKLTFLPPDFETFKAPLLARELAKKGGNLPAIFTRANDEYVKRFLDGRITFLQIYQQIHRSIKKATFVKNPSLKYLQNLIPKAP